MFEDLEVIGALEVSGAGSESEPLFAADLPLDSPLLALPFHL
ncbi:MAG TPA: hypothetical protein PLQ49_03245 [Methanothrix sp.]|nr:hypothetical protein [Methanothrix sp.]HRW82125.1 hypothetical protein [Methanothrix sp.]